MASVIQGRRCQTWPSFQPFCVWMPQYTLPSADLPDPTGPRLSTVNIAYGFTQIHPSKDSVYLILEIQLSYLAPPQTTPHRSKAVQVIASAFSFFDSGCLLPWPLGRPLSRYRINKSPKDLQQPQHVTAWPSWQLL